MEKDTTTNQLIGENDVFADLVNVNLFEGELEITADDLTDIPIDTTYKDTDGVHRRLFRDVLKRCDRIGGCVAFLGFESQTAINNVMPVRSMGYDYNTYLKQIREIVARNNKEGNSAYAKVIHDYQKLKPVATAVLYFGNKELINTLERSETKLIHVEETLDMLEAISRDSRYGSIKEAYMCMDEEEKEENRKMCELLDRIENRGIAMGIERGIERGHREGTIVKLIYQIRKKVNKGKSLPEIADEVEEDVLSIQGLYNLIMEYPELSDREIYEMSVEDE